MRWTVLIPAKALPGAKSRLAESRSNAAGDARSPHDATGHGRLVGALRADTVAAAKAARNVARVVLVVESAGTEVPGADVVIVQSTIGLNPALAEAADICAVRWPRDGVAALVGDLPALTADELADALEHAATSPLGFVADSAGTGTTMLTARPGTRLDPQFGADSASRHAGFAAALPAGPGLRQDVDTDADLRRALRLGVGACTQAAVSPRMLCSPGPGTMSV